MKRYFLLSILLTLTFSAIGEPSAACEKASTTFEINECAKNELELAKTQLRDYYEASLKEHADDPTLTEAIITAQKKWEAYRDSHCDSIWTMWRDGTIRTVLALSCETTLTKQRTHDLWETFLTNMWEGGTSDFDEPED